MLSGNWLFITLILLVAAIITNQAALFMITFLFFCTSGITRLWSWYSLQRLDYKCELSAKRVFFGESITLNMTLSNGKFLPLPWVNIEEEVPSEINFLKKKALKKENPNRPLLSAFFTLRWYYRVIRRYPIQCLRRGVFTFGPGRIITGDPFGFFRKNLAIDEYDQLMVYPPIIPIETLGIPSRHPFGDLRIRRHLFEDPVQVMTTRDYVRGDPVKRIHWKTSARVQRLQCRVFEHTTTMDMALFLDTRTVPRSYLFDAVDTDLLETGIIAAAAIASHSIKNGYKVGLFINEFLQNRILPKIRPSEHPDQFKRILEALAYIRGMPLVTVDIDKIISKEARHLSWETTIVLITAVLTNKMISVLKNLRKAGRRVSLILIGKKARSIHIHGITTYKVHEEVYQKQLESLRMEQIV